MPLHLFRKAFPEKSCSDALKISYMFLGELRASAMNLKVEKSLSSMIKESKTQYYWYTLFLKASKDNIRYSFAFN